MSEVVATNKTNLALMKALEDAFGQPVHDVTVRARVPSKKNEQILTPNGMVNKSSQWQAAIGYYLKMKVRPKAPVDPAIVALEFFQPNLGQDVPNMMGTMADVLQVGRGKKRGAGLIQDDNAKRMPII